MVGRLRALRLSLLCVTMSLRLAHTNSPAKEERPRGPQPHVSQSTTTCFPRPTHVLTPTDSGAGCRLAARHLDPSYTSHALRVWWGKVSPQIYVHLLFGNSTCADVIKGLQVKSSQV